MDRLLDRCLVLQVGILSWKATEISSFSLRLEFCVILQHLYVLP